MDWATRMAPVDQAVDNELGDEVEFAANGVAFSTIKGFVFPAGTEAEIGYAAIDPLSGNDRMKVSVATIAKPSKQHRFRVPQLKSPDETLYRPENWVKVDAGRNWLIDLQQAVT